MKIEGCDVERWTLLVKNIESDLWTEVNLFLLTAKYSVTDISYTYIALETDIGTLAALEN